MRIALDARTIYRSQRRGTGKNLIDLYQQVARLRPAWQVVAYHREHSLVAPLLPAQNVQPRHIEIVGDRLHAWERLRLPLAAVYDKADVLHCPANTCPRWMALPLVVTIHDLIPLDMPGLFDPLYVRWFARSVRQACRHAAGLICPSHYTAGRLQNEFGAAPGKITVNPWAPDSSIRRCAAEEVAGVLARYGVPQPYVLHLGARDARKNTHGVLQAWAMLEPALRQHWQLLVVGLDEQTLAQYRAAVDKLGLTQSVHLHGYAAEEDLPALLSGAAVLAYPSLAEGFGLPILDAWAAGTAVLTSSTTSLPEVAGEAAVLVNPRDAGAIATGLSGLLSNAAVRQKLVRQGQERLRNYTWRGTAERFIAALERAVAQGGLREAA